MFKYLKSVLADVRVDGRYFFHIFTILALGQLIISLCKRIFLGQVWGIEKFILDNMYWDHRFYVHIAMVFAFSALVWVTSWKLACWIVEKGLFKKLYKK